MGERTGRFERADRLRRTRDYRRLDRTGRRRASKSFVVLTGRSPGRTRLGLTVGRRVGNAVVRNRIKRRTREWFRRNRGRLEPGTELVVIARRPAAELGRGEVAACLDCVIFGEQREGET